VVALLNGKLHFLLQQPQKSIYMKLETITFECPFCCVSLKHELPEYTDNDEIIRFSDGFTTYPGQPFFSKLVQCPVCNEVFLIDSIEDHQPCRNDNPCTETMEPAFDRYFEFLKNSALTPEQDLMIRLEIWHLGNHHPDRNSELLNDYDSKEKWIEHLDYLETLLAETNPEQLLLKAELNRHLGRFTRSLELLDAYQGDAPAKFIKTIRKKISKGNTEVFEI
jgi:hypothetical protein